MLLEDFGDASRLVAEDPGREPDVGVLLLVLVFMLVGLLSFGGGGGAFATSAFEEFEPFEEVVFPGAVLAITDGDVEIRFEGETSREQQIRSRDVGDLPGGRRVVVAVAPFLHDGADLDPIAPDPLEQIFVGQHGDEDAEFFRGLSGEGGACREDDGGGECGRGEEEGFHGDDGDGRHGGITLPGSSW